MKYKIILSMKYKIKLQQKDGAMHVHLITIVCEPKSVLRRFLAHTEEMRLISCLLYGFRFRRLFEHDLACNRFLSTNFSSTTALFFFNISFKLKCLLFAKDYGKMDMQPSFLLTVDSKIAKIKFP